MNTCQPAGSVIIYINYNYILFVIIYIYIKYRRDNNGHNSYIIYYKYSSHIVKLLE